MALSRASRAALTRVVADLKIVDGLSLRAIARYLDISHTTARRMARAGGWDTPVVPGVVTRVGANGAWEIVGR